MSCKTFLLLVYVYAFGGLTFVVAQQKRVVFIGDSHIAQGDVAKTVANYFDVYCKVHAWNGASAKDFLEQNKIPKKKYHLCIVSLGSNRPKDVMSYKRLIEQLKKYQKHIVLTTPNQVYYDTSPIRQTIYQIAKRFQIPVWDFYRYTKVSGMMTNPRLVESDRVHLTKAGYLLQGRLLCEFLEKITW